MGGFEFDVYFDTANISLLERVNVLTIESDSWIIHAD